MGKKKVVTKIHGVEYSVRDLKESLKNANAEAKGYMEGASNLRKANTKLAEDLAESDTNFGELLERTQDERKRLSQAENVLYRIHTALRKAQFGLVRAKKIREILNA